MKYTEKTGLTYEELEALLKEKPAMWTARRRGSLHWDALRPSTSLWRKHDAALYEFAWVGFE